MEENTGSFCLESCGRGSAARGESEATDDEARAACSQHGRLAVKAVKVGCEAARID